MSFLYLTRVLLIWLFAYLRVFPCGAACTLRSHLEQSNRAVVLSDLETRCDNGSLVVGYECDGPEHQVLRKHLRVDDIQHDPFDGPIENSRLNVPSPLRQSRSSARAQFAKKCIYTVLC